MPLVLPTRVHDPLLGPPVHAQAENVVDTTRHVQTPTMRLNDAPEALVRPVAGTVPAIGPAPRCFRSGIMGRVYVPHFNALEDHAEIARLVDAVGSVELITTGPDGYPLATLLPVVRDDD